jgi:uncharacterized membrane protein YkvA (DUF1232 family)
MRVARSFGLGRVFGGLDCFIMSTRLAWRLLRDRRTPLVNKLIIPATFAYLFWPLDFLPDILPFLGHVDDLTAVAMAVLLFVNTAPRRLVAEHRADILGEPYPRGGAGDAIEGEFRVVDDSWR